jgi:ferrochelatase
MRDACANPIDAVMLIGFGGPENAAQIRPFLDRVLKGRPVPPQRYEEVVHHYEALGGRSPYNELTRRQADALCDALRRRGIDLPVVVGFRNAWPYFTDALQALMSGGVQRVLGFILSSLQCEASWQRYQREVADARAVTGDRAPRIIYPASWHLHPRFIEAATALVGSTLKQLTHHERANAELIFTAHSIPLSMAQEAPYVSQLRDSAAAVASACGCPRWSIAYQSRSGNPRDPWLEPDVREAIVKNAAPKIVVPIGFLIDHVEVLYDLDIEASELAKVAGIQMLRANTVGNHPAFLQLMVDLVAEHV